MRFSTIEVTDNSEKMKKVDIHMPVSDDPKRQTRSTDLSTPAKWSRRVLKNVLLLLTIVSASTLLSELLKSLSLNESNFIMTYLLCVVVVAYVTEGYLYSIAASVLSVLAFNFFFINPYFSFHSYGRDYSVTFAVMFLVALVTSSMTARIKLLKDQSEHRELRLRFINRIIRSLATTDNAREIAEIATKEIADFLGVSSVIAVAGSGGALQYKHMSGEYAFGSIDDDVACLNALHSGGMDNAESERYYSSPKALFFPIVGQDTIMGVMGVSFKNGRYFTDNTKAFLATLGAQVAFVLERAELRQKQEQIKFDMEKERLRTNLLHGISHDLRTPLTAILGSAGALRDHFATLDERTKLGFINEVVDESEWLKQLVENTVYLTKMEEKEVRLTKEAQPVEEIIAAVLDRCKKRADGTDLLVEMPDALLMVPADATLIAQALINLLDNAFRHSPPGARVTLRATKSPPDVVFEVIDQGAGIAPEELGKIFDRFFTAEKTTVLKGRHKGLGLGLTVSKTIIEAHGGTLTAANNSQGGATFRFTLPLESQ